MDLLKRRLIKELRIIGTVNFIISLKWLCQTLTPEYFHHLNTCLFSKLVSHIIKVRSQCNFFKPFLVDVVNIMEKSMYKKVS